MTSDLVWVLDIGLRPNLSQDQSWDLSYTEQGGDEMGIPNDKRMRFGLKNYCLTSNLDQTEVKLGLNGQLVWRTVTK